ARIAAQIDGTFAIHGAADGLIGERKWEIVICRSRHVHGMQHRVAALDLQGSVVGYEQHMRFVAAVSLVKKLASFGQVHRLTLGDVFQKHDRVGNSAIGSDEESLKIAFLLGLRIADLWIFIYENGGNLGDAPGPLHRSSDVPAIIDSDGLVARLGGAVHRSHDEQDNYQNKLRLHSAPLGEFRANWAREAQSQQETDCFRPWRRLSCFG